MDRNIGLEAGGVAEAAAMGSAGLVGSGGEGGALGRAGPPGKTRRPIDHGRGGHAAALPALTLTPPRHEQLIAEVRATGARIKLIGDGDVSAAIATCFPETGVDVLMGTGGAPEGVIAAAALRCCGAGMQGQLAFRNDKEIERARNMGIARPHRTCAR